MHQRFALEELVTVERNVDAKRSTLPPEKAIVRALFDDLERRGVRYCHWKSNIRLADTLAGKEDIDILVDPHDEQVLLAALVENGYRLTTSRAGLDHPGVFHALALDDATATLVDLHAYFQVVSGDSLVKNYRLPLATSLLASSRMFLGVRTPAASVELAVFVVRMILKHVSLVEILKANRHYGKVLDEHDWLLEQASAEDAARACEHWFPEVGAGVFNGMLAAVGDRHALGARILLGWQLAWRLRRFRRLGGLAAFTSRFWRLGAFIGGRLTRRRDLALRTGGAVVALVGPKGTGKSTLGNEIARRLGRHLAVVRIHSGKPPASLASALPMLLLPLARRLLPRERLGEYEKPERRENPRYSLIYMLRRCLLAHDRRLLLHRAARQAASGIVVLSDRYPSPVAGATDSSAFDEATIAATDSRIKRRLMLWERSCYANLPRPDLVLRLDAPLAITLERDAQRMKRGGPDPDAVRRRREIEQLAAYPGSNLAEIDTGGDLDATAAAATRAVWSAL